MNNWYACNLGDAMLAGEMLEQIKAHFQSEYGKESVTEERAVFFRHESEGRLHCEVKLYFTPAAFAVAESVNATPCSRPSPHGLSLLAGPQASWSLFAPATEGKA